MSDRNACIALLTTLGILASWDEWHPLVILGLSPLLRDLYHTPWFRTHSAAIRASGIRAIRHVFHHGPGVPSLNLPGPPCGPVASVPDVPALGPPVVDPPPAPNLMDRRGDGPRKQCKQPLALAVAADPDRMSAALRSLHTHFYAPATWASHSSEVKLYMDILVRHNTAHGTDLAPFPTSAHLLNIFAACLKEAGYRAGPQYLSAVTRHNSLLGYALSSHDTAMVTRYNKSLLRGIGDTKHVDGITVLQLHMSCPPVNSTERLIFSWRLMVVGWFFMLRNAELLGLRKADVSFERSPAGGAVPIDRVVITLGATKTNTKGVSLTRALDCTCAGRTPDRTSVCPAHALASLVFASRGDANVRLTPRCGTVISPDAFRGDIRTLLSDAGIDTLTDEGLHRFGTHSLRRGGAQALARAGWPMDVIKTFGRWLSDAVELYTLEVPLQTHGHRLAHTMLHGVTGACDSVEIAPRRLCKDARVMFEHVDAWHEAWVLAVASEPLDCTLPFMCVPPLCVPPLLVWPMQSDVVAVRLVLSPTPEPVCILFSCTHTKWFHKP